MQGIDIITDIDLKLKPGVHYGLIGRNGSGKSNKFTRKYASLHKYLPWRFTYRHPTLLRVIATKIIPGLPDSIRITILQQTASDDDAPDTPLSLRADTRDPMKRTPLQKIIESDTARNDIQLDLHGQYDPTGEFSSCFLGSVSMLLLGQIPHTSREVQCCLAVKLRAGTEDGTKYKLTGN